MFEFLHQIAMQYGLPGLFMASSLGSTLFLPITLEPLLFSLHKLGLNAYAIILTATIGSLLWTLINYYIGYHGSKITHRRLTDEQIHKIRRIMNRHGLIGLLTLIAIPFPIPVDPITVLCGLGRMDLLKFSIVILTGKAIKYSFLMGIFSMVF